MTNFEEEDFCRLRKDKKFANEVLMCKSKELLRSAYNLYSKNPEKMNEIINSIGYSIDKLLNTKDKLKVIHVLSKEMRSMPVMGIRNLYSLGASKIEALNKELDNVLEFIENKEEGKIQEREDNMKTKTPDNKDVILYGDFKGFKTTFTPEQVEIHYNTLRGTFIDKNTRLNDYTAVFKNAFLPDDFIPLRWMLLTKFDRPHKTALREFLTLALDKSPDQKTINICFTDIKGGKIQLAKPKSGDYSNYIQVFENLFKK